MASNQTENFGLCQWEGTDPVLWEDFNEDNRKIDEAMAGFGNCKIDVGSYVGTGTCKEANPNVLTFDFQPKFLLVRGSSYSTSLYGFSGWFFWSEGGETAAAPMAGGTTNYANYISRTGNTLSWYNVNNEGCQLNSSDTTYYYIALG